MKTKGIVRYSSTNRPDTKYNTWYVDISVTKEEKIKLEGIGIKCKVNVGDDEKITYSFKASRKVERRRGKEIIGENQPPIVLDAALNKFDGIIGQGSEVIVVFKPYAWSYKGRDGVSADLCKVQVLNLVPYISEGGDNSELDDGDNDLKVEGEGIAKPEIEDEESTTNTGDDVPF